MFGQNPIVGQKYFDDAKDKLLVTSVFFTLQGEGPYRGEPAMFVRLAKCNLACSFCDTNFDIGDWMTPSDIFTAADQSIKTFFATRDSTVPNFYELRLKKRQLVFVLTGGEPMIQKNIGTLLALAELEYEKTQIESNGLLLQNIPDSTTLVLSPKCLEKDGVAIRYMMPHPKAVERADCLKFVVSSDADSPYSDIPLWAYEWRERTGKVIYISPMNIYNQMPARISNAKLNSELTTWPGDGLEKRSREEVVSFWEEGLLNMQANRANHEYAGNFCVKGGFTLSLQQHLFASLA